MPTRNPIKQISAVNNSQICKKVKIAVNIDKTSQIIVPTENAFRKSTRKAFGVSLRASGLIIGAIFMKIMIHRAKVLCFRLQNQACIVIRGTLYSCILERFVYGVFTPLQFLVFNGLSGVVGL